MHEDERLFDALATTLSELGTAFEPGELAYLALTSKAELPIRDRLAWRLQNRLGDAYVVSREWRRADIAVLEHDVPRLQVEAKAMYGFDVLSAAGRGKYLAKLRADAIKMSLLAPDAVPHLLALITYVDGSIETHLRQHVVKYSSGIAAALQKHAGALAVQAQARDLWESDIAQLGGPVRRFNIQGGAVWGATVQVDAYLMGPLSSHAKLRTANG